ncbi:MAG: 6-phosphogluconolactonase [Gammaproteobacteria bacterium]|nr:6-phosphogluconolactonase [Gammaproteobacteria bacterium]
MQTLAVTPEIHADAEALSRAAAGYVLAAAQSAIATRGVFHLALAGGSTPRRLYQLLAATPADRVDWPHWQIWFGDERCVPPDHADSNYRMAREALLDHVAIPAAQIHPMVHHPDDPAADARAYAGQLTRDLITAAGVPVLDLVLLGMGDDGHTASLFPGTDILAVDDRPVAAVAAPGKGWRISLTYPVLERARERLFLVAGAAKAPVLAQVLADPQAAAPYPVARLAAGGGRWLLDRAAAQALDGPQEP